jgi:hypothetical protein
MEKCKSCSTCKHYTGYECLIRKVVIVTFIENCGSWERCNYGED